MIIITASYAVKRIFAREILDSRGNPTVECEVHIGSHKVFASVPSGASTGKHEALELRDKDAKRYHGKGVLQAIQHVNTVIAKKIHGKDVRKLGHIDELMMHLDGTHDKHKLGANAILSVSMACARACAIAENKPLYSILGKGTTLPVPMMNVINGGVHGGNNIAIQEFMIVPYYKNFSESLQIGTEVYHELKNIIKNKGLGTTVGDEGGFAPTLSKTTDVLDLMMKAIDNLGYEKEVKLALDCAASEFFTHDGKYHIDGKKVSAHVLADFYEDLSKHYPIYSIEDPFNQDDFSAWKHFMQRKLKLQVIGDDLLVTNTNRIKMALERKLCNALLLKVNQIGSVSEALNAANLAFKNKWNVIVSHRSGETTDDFIADLVVGLNAGQCKFGAPCRGERLAKYNRLLRIEEELGKRAKFVKPW